jgi:hypothetical protein
MGGRHSVGVQLLRDLAEALTGAVFGANALDDLTFERETRDLVGWIGRWPPRRSSSLGEQALELVDRDQPRAPMASRWSRREGVLGD